MPSLTLCVIARDEEALIGRCLASVRGLADRIVVVDTGSTDRTAEIAREHGALVVPHVWQDDFAAARNAALEHVRSGFVLVLDADERLGPGAKSALRKALARDDLDCGLLELHDAATLDAEPTDVVAGRARRGEPVLLPRLLRRTPDLAWEGIVHEQVTSWARRGKRIASVPARIVHYGAVPSLRLARRKGERNRRLLESRCAARPDDAIARAYLARELERAGETDRAWLEAERAWSTIVRLAGDGRPDCDVVLPATLASFLSLQRGAPERALEIVRRARGWTEPHPNLELLEGTAHETLALRAGDVEGFAAALADARAAFERCLALRGRSFAAETMPGATTFTGRTRLGTVALLAGDLETAREAFRAALGDSADSREARLGLVETLLDAGDPASALAELQPSLAEDCPDAWLLAAACAAEFGREDDALLFLDRSRAARDRGRAWLSPHRRGRCIELETALRPGLVPAAAREHRADTASVVIPAFNRLELLKPVLEAFLREARASAFELIVVDDGSRPPVRELVESLGSPAALRLVERATNGGRGAALDTGLDASRADVVVFCDSDIVPAPGFVEDHLRFHRERGNELATHLGALSWGVDAGLFGAWMGARSNPRLRGGSRRVGWTQWFTDNWSFRRSLLASRGLRFDERYRVWGWEELDLARRLVAIGATNETTGGARGLHLKPSTFEGTIASFARSVPNLVLLAGSAPDDRDVASWLSARCETDATWRLCREAAGIAWARASALDALAGVRDVGDARIDRAAVAMSDLAFRLGIARGFLDLGDDAAPGRGSDEELVLALVPAVAALGAVEESLAPGSGLRPLRDEVADALAPSATARRAFDRRFGGAAAARAALSAS